MSRSERLLGIVVSATVEHADVLAPTSPASGTVTALTVAAGVEVSGGEAAVMLDRSVTPSGRSTWTPPSSAGRSRPSRARWEGR